METFSNVANQCHFVPCPRSDPRRAKPRSETPEPIAQNLADGDCTNPFRDRVLNRFWTWRSGMKTFSNVAWFNNACDLGNTFGLTAREGSGRSHDATRGYVGILRHRKCYPELNHA
jgi:hypothetical protein